MDSIQPWIVAGIELDKHKLILKKARTLGTGQLVPLLCRGCFPAAQGSDRPLGCLEAGTRIGLEETVPFGTILGTAACPLEDGTFGRVYWLEINATVSLAEGSNSITSWKQGYTLARVTLSDKGAAGLREDSSGPVIEEMVGGTLEIGLVQRYILPDEHDDLRHLLTSLCLEQRIDLVITTGGTGLTSRDIAPEATLSVIEKRLAGMEQAMCRASLSKTPHGALSRAVAGTLGASLIINLPGSPKAVRENLSPLLPALEHALKKLKGDSSDCAALGRYT